MQNAIYKIVSQTMYVPIHQINDDSSPQTISNWDSLKQINLILALEEEFQVAFSDEEIIDMLSVKNIIDMLSKKKSKDSVL